MLSEHGFAECLFELENDKVSNHTEKATRTSKQKRQLSPPAQSKEHRRSVVALVTQAA